MTNDTQQIVNKAWNFAHVLRDDGLSYMAYTEQITFLLAFWRRNPSLYWLLWRFDSGKSILPELD